MAKDDYHCIVYYLLSYLYSLLKQGEPIDADIFALEAYPADIEPSYYQYIIEHLLEDGLIERAHFESYPIMGRGPVVKLKNVDKVRITPKGIEYLQENGTMKKAYNALKALKETIPLI